MQSNSINGAIAAVIMTASSGICAGKNSDAKTWIALVREDFNLIPIAELQPTGFSALWTTPDNSDSNKLSRLRIPSLFYSIDSLNAKKSFAKFLPERIVKQIGSFKPMLRRRLITK
jgi:hypothetical protein